MLKLRQLCTNSQHQADAEETYLDDFHGNWWKQCTQNVIHRC